MIDPQSGPPNLMPPPPSGALDASLQLADWRRRTAALWAAWRAEASLGPAQAARATLAFRAAKDALFRDHPQSPLPEEGRGTAFAGLRYWPYDPAWRLTVRLEPALDMSAGPSADTLALPSSGPEPLAFRRLASVVLAGPLTGRRLSLFWLEGYAGGLFLPLRDATASRETYGAGRYLLDTSKGADQGWAPGADAFVLDLNLAYHPSCAYDPRWACPLAPPENRLDLPVRAGERLATDGDG
ncbi:MAG TPA: DUF1684 domain-containing protein [Candidatus Limnocylindrales bacterium]|jgi:uncharacterized protein (DUF1684 family)|nr:DUF1684 domain-containing protein [Candidatus Limnocylindrales bacterium]